MKYKIELNIIFKFIYTVLYKFVNYCSYFIFKTFFSLDQMFHTNYILSKCSQKSNEEKLKGYTETIDVIERNIKNQTE